MMDIENNFDVFEVEFDEEDIPVEFLSESTTTHLYYYWFTKPKGMFTLTYLKDYAAASIPTLNIINCEFKNFNFHQYAYSLIALDPVVSSLNI